MYQWERSVRQKLISCDTMRRAHTRASFIWGRTGSVLEATVTVIAALTGGSAIASVEPVAVVLGVVTAVVGGLLSALAPRDRSAQHLVSANDFSRAYLTTERLYLRAATRGLSEADFDSQLDMVSADIAKAGSRPARVQPREREQQEAVEQVDELMTFVEQSGGPADAERSAGDG